MIKLRKDIIIIIVMAGSSSAIIRSYFTLQGLNLNFPSKISIKILKNLKNPKDYLLFLFIRDKSFQIQ